MNKKSTYGELIESLAALIGLLGVVLCLQTSVASVQLQDESLTLSEEKLCCIHAEGFAHGHAQSSLLSEQLSSAVPTGQQVFKGFGELAALQKAACLFQLKALAQELRQQYSIHSSSPLLLSKRHIRFRSIII